MGNVRNKRFSPIRTGPAWEQPKVSLIMRLCAAVGCGTYMGQDIDDEFKSNMTLGSQATDVTYNPNGP